MTSDILFYSLLAVLVGICVRAFIELMREPEYLLLSKTKGVSRARKLPSTPKESLIALDVKNNEFLIYYEGNWVSATKRLTG